MYIFIIKIVKANKRVLFFIIKIVKETKRYIKFSFYQHEKGLSFEGNFSTI